MSFGTRQMLAKHDVSELRFQNTYIKNVETVKYLVIRIDKELSWNFQIEQMCSKNGRFSW